MTKQRLPSLWVGGALLSTPALALAQDEIGADYLVIFGGFIAGLIALVIIFNFLIQVRRARFETIRMLIEKGEEVPPQLYGPGATHAGRPANAWTPEEYRGHAIGWGNLFTFLGLGIGLANYLSSGDWRAAAWGLVFVFLGIGSFVNALIIHRGIRKQPGND
jgi:hypothetical protein